MQVLLSERSLFPVLPGYALLALGGGFAFAFRRDLSTGDAACLGTTLLFGGYIIARALTSPDGYAARIDLYLAVAAISFYGLITSVLRSPASRMGLIGLLLGFASVHVLVGVVQAGLGKNYAMLFSWLEHVAPDERATGFFVNPDHLAGLLEVLGIFGLCLACWSRRAGWLRVLIAYLAGLCYVGLSLTGSRGGYLSAAIGLILLASFSLVVLWRAGAGTALRLAGGMLLLISILGAGGWFFVRAHVPLREVSIEVFTTDEGRLGLWQAALDQWKLQPLVGTGSGTYRFYGREFRAPKMQMDPGDAHNDYLQLLAEYGLVGAAIFLLFLASHLRAGWRSFRMLGPQRIASGGHLLSDRLALNLGALCALATCAAHSVVDYNMHLPANALLLVFATALLADSGLNLPAAARAPRFRLAFTLIAALGAVVLFVQSARLYPGEHFTEKARLALRDENPAGAIEQAEEALRYEQKNPRTYFILGRALSALGNQPEQAANRSALYAKALSAFARAEALAPLDGSYPLEIAFLHDESGDFAAAEPFYQRALARDPHSISMRNLYQSHLERWHGEPSPR